MPGTVAHAIRSSNLRHGAHIAIIGGGPAGSAFALFALHFAQQVQLDLQVTVFEARDFSLPGPWGCNMCAGLIPVRVLGLLREVGVHPPPSVICERIGHYTLHTPAGEIRVPQPDPDGDVISVFRGSGPRDGCGSPPPGSFDGFLLGAARTRGATVVRERVMSVDLAPRATVTAGDTEVRADLVVLAAGVNRSTVPIAGVAYQPPRRRQMAQCELCPGADGVRASLQGGVHIVLTHHEQVSFGTLIPKGPCIGVSLLGDDLAPGSLARFLALPDVADLLPPTVGRACSCRPRIAVGTARPLFADRFAAVGDASVTRLYKNGIGSALLTARQAAHTAIHHGVGASDFRVHYAPLCRSIALDNLAGRFLFSFSRMFRGQRWLTLPHLHSIAAEQALPPGRRRHSRLLWGMFSGVCSYQELLAMALHPALHVGLLRGALREAHGPSRSRPVA
jgi:flavin-dependent dehydrogenase